MRQKFTLSKNLRAVSKVLFALIMLGLPLAMSAQIVITVDETDVACFGDCTGSATANPTGGTAPYTYFWNTGATTATANALCGSVGGTTYDVTVTDANGLTAVEWAKIFSPSQFVVTAFGSSQICGLAPDGTATAVPSGGVPPYTYAWSNGGTTAQITNLAAGTYTVTSTDANGCTAAASATVDFWNEGIWLMDSTVNITCPGANDGFIHISAMSGTPPYSYNWSNGATGADQFNLGPGNYTVTVTDANGCSNQITVVLSQPTGMTLNPSSTGASCGNTGSATVSVTGGAAPYTYSWSNGSTNSTISNLAAGTYSVTVTDANGCTANASVTVNNTGGNLTVTATKNSDATCNTGGSATANATGGSNYTYMWSNGQSTATVTGLNAGTYTVTVVDGGSGCTGTASVTINQIPGPTVNVTLNSDATCTTGGSATANASGTSGPYTYSWDNGQTTAMASNLSAGQHSVTATDANGCTGVGTVTIGMAPGPMATATLVSDASCSAPGSATAAGSGGTAPYTYLWDNGETTATATNLMAGSHMVTVTDAAGCSATATVNIGQTGGGPMISFTDIMDASCNDDGTAKADVTGGTAPYTYAWNNGQTTSIAVNLAAGTYTVIVSDAAGCSATDMVTIGQIPDPVASATVDMNATCMAGGSATASGSSGVAPYLYNWSNGQNTATATNLAAGPHSVTVIDANGCFDVATVTVQGSPMPSVSITQSSNATCDQKGSATAMGFGGTPPFSYEWDNGVTAAMANLQEGTHEVTVTDDAGCTATTTVTIGLTNNGIKVGDLVWFDTQQDGFQTPGHSDGVPNVTVRLYKVGPDGIACTADDILQGTQTTDSDGNYLFDCVTAGMYYMMFSDIPAGYQFTKQDNVNNDCKDSDADAAGKTATFTVVQGQVDELCIDAGIHQACSNIINAGNVCCSQEICEGDTPAPLYNVTFPTGGSGAIEYLWLRLTGANSWAPVPNGNSANLNLGPLSVTTHFMRCARRAGCVTYLESNIVTIKVLPNTAPGCQSFLTNFNVRPTQASTIMVEWTVRPELNEYNYFVERSGNAVDWESIGMVNGEFDNTSTVDYEYMDTRPTMGMNWYRIRRVDANDIETLSNAVFLEVDVALAESLSISPTLIENNVRINNLITYDSDVTLELVSMSGKVVHNLTIPADTYIDVELPMQDKAAGVYALRIRFADGTVRTVKMMKH